MKNYLFIPAVIALLTLHACQSDSRERSENQNGTDQAPVDRETPAKLIELLVGEWKLENAGNAGQQQGNLGDRLTFTEEARYIAKAGDQKVDSGAFRMNEQLRNLYLESEATKQPREYELTLEQDLLTLTPTQAGQGGAQGTTSLRYRRSGPASISPEKRGEQ